MPRLRQRRHSGQQRYGSPISKLGAAGGLLAAFVSIGLASCGWQPLYAPATSGVSMGSRVDVAIIPDRQGQLLRQALQARLGAGGPPEFVLQAQFALDQEGIGVMQDSSLTRVRLIGSSSFVLRALADGRTCVTGTARSVDGYDLENQQFFAGDLEGETAQRRVAEALADQIALKLAIAFKRPGGPRCEAG